MPRFSPSPTVAVLPSPNRLTPLRRSLVDCKSGPMPPARDAGAAEHQPRVAGGASNIGRAAEERGPRSRPLSICDRSGHRRSTVTVIENLSLSPIMKINRFHCANFEHRSQKPSSDIHTTGVLEIVVKKREAASATVVVMVSGTIVTVGCGPCLGSNRLVRAARKGTITEVTATLSTNSLASVA